MSKAVSSPRSKVSGMGLLTVTGLEVEGGELAGRCTRLGERRIGDGNRGREGNKTYSRSGFSVSVDIVSVLLLY